MKVVTFNYAEEDYLVFILTRFLREMEMELRKPNLIAGRRQMMMHDVKQTQELIDKIRAAASVSL